ncbi:malto-oligosyltrehalose trehalohydrolase [Deinococcus yavapaiensis]|uniref:Malto-oligosyltrehalose trehalohydrolase n=1 Tax=Deinococcus yavapaiensis KR-236 TaxID=694435 RepID=A0A318SEP4_9DEIO|nr:malto-oligosyltrehalose trehalohydrolase [Deinococcus yavapaiensis]PYE56257.1 maltooligosyl trehalose hydrolase [Deinococcus yavapaiensis KR-236]
MTQIQSASQRQVPLLGAHADTNGTTFRAWTTQADAVDVVLFDRDQNELERRSLRRVADGLFEGTFEDVKEGALYKFALGGDAWPDPYARWMPYGVHGPAEVWAPSYEFKHDHPKVRREELVIYELHVGTFTAEGTYAAATEKLSYLAHLGVNCLELLPLSAFPGRWGWGYDGVAHFAPFKEYGSPEDLMRLIDEAHGLGLVVLLDMVYNHFGPSGNYLPVYSDRYFTARHKTPWGDALDYTNPYLRALVTDSAQHWLKTYRFDGFRLDATQSIQDDSQYHILQELADKVHALGGSHFLFCEDYRNLPDLVTQFHMDGIWADDFHHQVRVCLTGEQDGHFRCYAPKVDELARGIAEGWLYYGQCEWPLEPGFIRGKPADELEASNLIYFVQNHDQIGNRAFGDRLQETAGEDGFLAASMLLLFLPTVPLLFQGQEWMASTRFAFFSDHEGELGHAVSTGRLEEFGHFEAFQKPELRAQIPDPQDETTFHSSKLDWDEANDGVHAKTLGLYRELLRLRREDPVLTHRSRRDLAAGTEGDVLWVRRWNDDQQRVLLVNFGHEEVEIPARFRDLSPVAATHEGSGLAARSATILVGAR